MWRPLQNNIVAPRLMKNHAILAACCAKNHMFYCLDVVYIEDYVYNNK
jgi:hypothetical protein